jgi:hypothetical protein
MLAFQIMDEWYDDTKDIELGVFLSGMSPYMFSDSEPADPAIWSEWVECAERVQKNGTLTADNVLQTLVSLLELNEPYYGYGTSGIVKGLQDPVWQKRWRELLKKASALSDA